MDLLMAPPIVSFLSASTPLSPLYLLLISSLPLATLLYYFLLLLSCLPLPSQCVGGSGNQYSETAIGDSVKSGN